MDTMLFNPRLLYLSRLVLYSIALVGLGAAGLVLIDWIFKIGIFESLMPTMGSMKFNTALALALFGFALLAARGGHRTARFIAAFVMIWGLINFLQYLSDWQFGIDELFVADPETAPALYPGRMSPMTAVLIYLIGLSLFLTMQVPQSMIMLGQFLSLIAAFTALLAVSGYLYGVETLYQIINQFSSIQLHTAIIFVLFSLGIFLVYPDKGLAAWILMDRAGGHMAQRLLPLIVIFPLSLAWLRLRGQELGLYDTAFGAALFALSNVFIFTCLVFWTARSLNEVDLKREDALEALRTAHAELELKVQERTVELLQAKQRLETEIHERRELEAQQDSFFALSIDMLTIAGFDNHFIFVNPAFERTLGFSEKQLLERSFLDIVHPDDRSLLQSELKHLSEGRPTLNLEIRFFCADATYRWTAWTAQPIPEKGLIYAVGRDITAQKQAEALLQSKMDEEREFQNYLKSLQNVVIELTAVSQLDLFYKRAVEAGLEKFGFDRVGLLLYEPHEGLAIGTYGTDSEGRLIAEHHLRLNPSELTTILARTLRAEERFVVDEDAKLFYNQESIGYGQNAAAILWNGAEKLGWLTIDNAVRHQPISRPQLEILALYALSIGSVITQKRAQQQAFDMALEKGRIQLLSQFIQNSSHEFRTPLSIIRTNLFLLTKTDDKERQQAKIQNIEEQITRMTRLVDMLVILSSLDSGLEFSFSKQDLNLLLQDSCATIETAAGAKNLSLSLELAENLPLLNVDQSLLSQAVQQILDNAIRFTEAGGSIRVSTRSDASQASILVEDTGCGISDEALPHIFERFYREDAAHSTPGFGLGLAIAKTIVERHGGELVVATKAGEGSSFQILLPIEPTS